METPAGDVRQRAVALIQEAGSLLGMIPQLLDRSEELEAKADSASKEVEALRKELAGLRSEVQQLRTDREELTDGLTVIMNEILRLTGDAVTKLRSGEKRSAFWREASGAAAEGGPGRPAPAVASPWRREG
jgi:uncharacterized coiled-coil DUF342 family protein